MIPAPVRSRNSLTVDAGICNLLSPFAGNREIGQVQPIPKTYLPRWRFVSSLAWRAGRRRLGFLGLGEDGVFGRGRVGDLRLFVAFAFGLLHGSGSLGSLGGDFLLLRFVGGLAHLRALDDGVGDLAREELHRANRIVVRRNRVVDLAGVAVGVEQRDQRNLKTARLGHRESFLVRI